MNNNLESGRLTSGQFRCLFPALSRQVWLDTPAAPPAATPVSQALKTAIDQWTSGDFAWTDWVDAGEQARLLLASHLGGVTVHGRFAGLNGRGHSDGRQRSAAG